MWMMDMNGTLVNMDYIANVYVDFLDGCERKAPEYAWAIRANTQDYCSEGCPVRYCLGIFEFNEEAEKEFAKIKAKLMSQG